MGGVRTLRIFHKWRLLGLVGAAFNERQCDHSGFEADFTIGQKIVLLGHFNKSTKM